MGENTSGQEREGSVDGQGLGIAARTAPCGALAVEIVPGQPGGPEGGCAGGEVTESFTRMSPSAPVEVRRFRSSMV